MNEKTKEWLKFYDQLEPYLCNEVLGKEAKEAAEQERIRRWPREMREAFQRGQELMKEARTRRRKEFSDRHDFSFLSPIKGEPEERREHFSGAAAGSSNETEDAEEELGATAMDHPGFSSLPITHPIAERKSEEPRYADYADQTEEGNERSSFSFRTSAGLKVTVRSLKDYLSEAPPKREWTVEGILPESGLVVLGGRFKQGKSTLAVHLGRSIALGEPFIERKTKQKPVIYVNYEMPRDYFSSLLIGATAPEHFYIVDFPEPKLTVKTIRDVIETMKQRGWGQVVIIIDSFRGAFKPKGEDENMSGTAGLLLRTLQETAVSTGSLIIVIHHRNKNREQTGADSLSGTSDWGAAADVIWTWERPGTHEPGTLVIEGRMPPVDPLLIKLSPEECTYRGPAGEGREEWEKKRILGAMGSEKGVRGEQIEERTGIPYSTVMKRLEALQKNGDVTFEIGQGRGSPKLWSRTGPEGGDP